MLLRLEHKCYSGFIHGSQVDAIQMSTSGHMSKTECGIPIVYFLCHKREEVLNISRRDLEIMLLTDKEPAQKTNIESLGLHASVNL